MDPTTKNAVTLAREVAARLERGAVLDHFDHCILVAAPKLLGMLRDELKPAVLARLALTWDQNLGNIGDASVPWRLAPLLDGYERSKELKSVG